MARKDAPGRKIGTIAFHPRHLASHARERVELRLDESRGIMYATAYGTLCSAKTIEELRAELEKASDKAVNLTWTRVIDIDYKAHDGNGNCVGLDPDDDDRKSWPAGGVVKDVSLDWIVWDVSSPYGQFTESLSYSYLRERGKIYQRVNWIECELDDDGHYVRKKGNHYDYAKDWNGWPPGIVFYTDERIKVLRDLQHGLAGIDRIMRTMFEGSPEHLAKMIDRAIGGPRQFLLGDGKPAPKAKRRVR